MKRTTTWLVLLVAALALATCGKVKDDDVDAPPGDGSGCVWDSTSWDQCNWG